MYKKYAMTSLSAVIITVNQEKKIAKTIEALKALTNDIVVVDSGSTDLTRKVARAAGANVLERPWTGYSEQKNFGNQWAKYDWILSVDDDEVVSPELIESIKQAFTPAPEADAYDLPFRTVFAGKLIRFGGWNPESHVRIFNKKKIQWNTDAVHEGLTLKPEHIVKKLTGYVHHYTVDTPEQFIDKTDRYSTLFAEKGRKIGKKASFIKVYLSPAFRFLVEYIFKFGFLDGYYGWFIAKENARYTYLKYKKLR
ncbi:glycosyltransferase family 2 protein [Runella aurantiaca]|nr:glycosyltransferase family 2 protein [Runella aurantiaca]